MEFKSHVDDQLIWPCSENSLLSSSDSLLFFFEERSVEHAAENIVEIP